MPARPKLLISRRVFPEVLEHLAPHFDIDSNQADDEWSAEELRRRVADCDALFVVASDRVDAALLDAAPKLRIVSTGSVGHNHIDLAACAARGIVVGNTPEVLTEATADMAWTLLMAAARRVSESERWLRDGHWKRWAFEQFLGTDLFRSTLGIIGMGRIGSAVARRARGFEMTVLYCNRSRAANEAELGAGIVDDAALAHALSQGRIGAAGLDVYENEPAVHPALLEAPGVVLTPHIGSATRSSRVGMAMLAADNLIAFTQGRPLPARVATG